MLSLLLTPCLAAEAPLEQLQKLFPTASITQIDGRLLADRIQACGEGSTECAQDCREAGYPTTPTVSEGVELSKR